MDSFFRSFVLFFFLLTVSGCASEYAEKPLAFPGAEGVGKYATGGRYGEVYVVSNLNDSGPGSFRDAVSEPHRIVVFAVGGVINIDSRISVSPDITIAGQTAPGDGITIYGNGLSFSVANNAIVRYLRVRMGIEGDKGADAITITDKGSNMIFDHVSVSWGRDENFSITRDCDSITIQNSLIAQGLMGHSCGGLIEPTGEVSLYRNLYIDNYTRNPKVKGYSYYVNNVVYNWGGGGAYIMGGSKRESRVNIINNFFIEGPDTKIEPFTRGTETFIPYQKGNFLDDNKNGQLDGRLIEPGEFPGISQFNETPFSYPAPDEIMSAADSYEYVKKKAGASFPIRDKVDSFLIAELTSLGERGALISRESDLPFDWPVSDTMITGPVDSDKDGMPDEWEVENGLDPEDASDAMIINNSGYTNLEFYINGLVK